MSYDIYNNQIQLRHYNNAARPDICANINKASHLHSLNTRKTLTCDVGNPGPGLG